jgi:acyl transferase domain-containing protein
MGHMTLEPIAIIGAGCRFPGDADSPSRLWDLLRNPTDLSKRIPDDRFNPTTFFNENGEHHGASNVDKGYFLEENIREFDASFFNIAPKEAETIDPQVSRTNCM